MTGAAILAGQSALRAGAGLVTVAVPSSCQSIVAAACPVYMTMGLPWKKLATHLDKPFQQDRFAKAILAIGPGLGRRPNVDAFVVDLFQHWPNTMVIDADALNALAAHWGESTFPSIQPIGKRILTPHPGEWARISHVSASDRAGQIAAANELAFRTDSVVVLKSERTWITDGNRTCENSTGNPSLAVGGSGDCLTGLIAGLVCQGLDPFDAARLGVFLHGLAADLAHQSLQTPSTLATDLLAFLPQAFRQLTSSEASPQ
jgi:ADP-dependent NAD(P)H-hydrate dehydratase